TPGYPLFLAACRTAFGPSLLPIRFVQASLGAGCVWLTARLVATIRPEEAARPGWSVPTIPAAWAATDPYVVGLAALILSEALLLPVMVASLWGMAALWPLEGKRRGGLAIVVGLLSGAAILVRPSWALFVPTMLAAWVATVGKKRRGPAAK